MKNLCFFGGSFFQKKIADIWNFWWIRYLGEALSYLKKWGVGVSYCWNYGLSKLLLHLIKYRLDQLNSKHTKIAANSTMFSGSPTTKWRSCKTFMKLIRNHLLMVNIFKLHEYQTFRLMKVHNTCKIWFANNIFSSLRWNKNYFSWFIKAFQLPEIVSDLRLRLNYIGY